MVKISGWPTPWPTTIKSCFRTGAESDRQLGIPGEDLAGSDPATIFVGWYNGHPDYRDLNYDLSEVERVAVIGNGNVAMDVARILARSIEELSKTDIADYALEALKKSAVKEIYLLGRRGPAQAAFTNPEIRELTEMPITDLVVEPKDLELDEVECGIPGAGHRAGASAQYGYPDGPDSQGRGHGPQEDSGALFCFSGRTLRDR